MDLKKKQGGAKHWWLMSIILGTQEADIKRIMVHIQLGQIVHETLSWKIPNMNQGWLSGSGLEYLLASVRPWVQTPVQQQQKKKVGVSQW
jgi:hypothetical protein